VVTGLIVTVYLLSLVVAWRKIYVLNIDENWNLDEPILCQIVCVLFWPVFVAGRLVRKFYLTFIARETPGERAARLKEIAARCDADEARQYYDRDLPNYSPGVHHKDWGF